MNHQKLCVFFSTVALSLWGTDYTWNDANGTNNWDDYMNWTLDMSGMYPNSTSDTATFPDVSLSASTVNVDSLFAVDSLTFNGTMFGYTIDSTGGGSLNLGGGTSVQNITLTGTQSHVISSPLTLAGNILISQNSTGTLTVSGGVSGLYSVAQQGTGMVILEGTNTYTGATTVLSGTLQAGNTNAFAQQSDFTVNGTLDLNNLANQINTLSGSGLVTTSGSLGALTLSNGGNFTGTITGSGSVTLVNGTLNLGGINIYTGGTTISAGTLALVGVGQLSPSSPVVDNGTFDISGIAPATSTQIGDLTGNGVVVLGNNVLILGTANSTTFSGSITGLGSLEYAGTGTLTLSPVVGAPNSYQGDTVIDTGGTIKAGVVNAFAPLSTYDIAGTLLLNNFANKISVLNGAGAVITGGSSGILTITNGGAFSGGITGTGGLSLTGGTLVLSTGTSANTYSGATTVSNSAVLQSGAAGAISSSSAINLQNSSELDLQTFSNTIRSLSGDATTLVNIDTGATMTLTSGGVYNGIIQGAGALALSGGTLTLSNINTYTGGTTINAGTLKLTALGALDSTGDVNASGTFDISGISATSTEIGNLSGSGTVKLGTKELVVNTTIPSAFTGSMQGTLGAVNSLQVQGTSILTLTSSSYSGATTVESGATLQAGGANAFASSSAFTVNGTLDLNSFANKINALFGTGAVTTGSATGILTLASGGTFSGGISGAGGLTLSGGTLTLSGTTNLYSGPTLINNGAVLLADGMNTLSPNSAATVTGVLNLNNFSNSITSLSGTGTVTTGGSGGVLIVTNGGSFSGGIQGLGALSLTGGTLLLSNTLSPSANNYSGPTTVSNSAILQAGAANTFSPNSPVILNNSGTLSLNNFNNNIFSLASSSPTSSVTLGTAILTVNGGATSVYAGSMTGSTGGLTIDGGSNLTLSGTGNSYSGPTSILTGTLQINANGALSPTTDVTVSPTGTLALLLPETANSAGSLTNNGVVTNNGTLSLATTYTQSTGAALNLNFTNPLVGQITAGGNVSLNGTLSVIASAVPPPPPLTFYPLVTSATGITGQFMTFTPVGFGGTNPMLSYSPTQVSLYFGSCAGTWNSPPGTQSWGNFSNWVSEACAPGVNGNENDSATFVGIAGQPAITVLLADAAGTAPLTPPAVTLSQLNFNSATTQYTINQFMNAGSITFDATSSAITPMITVSQGQSFINVPLFLSLPTMMVLADGAQLTLEPKATLQSNTTSQPSSSGNGLLISQSGGSTTGSGLLINNGNATPFSLTMTSGSLLNNAVIAPNGTNGTSNGSIATLVIGALAGQNATVTNAGPNAQMGPTGLNANLTVGGAGTTTIINSGADTIFGPTGPGGNLIIGGTGPTTILNSGADATFGPTGPGGNLIIGGTGPTTILNSGADATFGPTGAGGSLMIGGNTTLTNTGLQSKIGAFGNDGNVTINSGSIANTDGAVLSAGPGGTLTITGGSITNDLVSTIGTTEQNIAFSAGTLNTSGNVFAYNYDQSGTSVLQLNLTSIPTILGNVAASGTATIDCQLVVDALPGSLAAGSSANLIYAERGVLGTYSSVTFLNFPASVIPEIAYTPNAVVLEVSQTVTPNSAGSLAEVSFVSVTETNTMIQRDQQQLFETIMKRKKKRKKEKHSSEKLSGVFSENGLIASAEPSLAAGPALRQEQLLAERVVEEAEPNPSRFYIGPIGSTGEFKTLSVAQTGFDYNSVGAFTGYDHAFDNWGLGGAVSYSSLEATLNHHHGHFKAHQAHGSVYATWAPPSLDWFAVNGIAGYGYEWVDLQRKAGLDLTQAKAKAKTHATEGDALLGAQYIFTKDGFEAMPAHLFVTPFLNLQYIGLHIDGYHEHNAGNFDLKVSGQTVHSLKSCLGMRFEYFVERENVTFRPEIDLGWQLEYFDHPRHIHFATINLPQTKKVSKKVHGAGRNTLWAGVDFLITAYKVFEVEISYDFLWNNLLYRNHAFYLGIGGNF